MTESNTRHDLKAQQLNLDFLQQNLTAAESAFDKACYTQALVHYESAMRDIDTVLPFKILMQCTRAHRAVGELERAIHDVLKAIEHHPVDPQGYLLAADLYLEQDMLRDALLTCDKGCAKANVDMPGYQDVQCMQSKVLQYLLKRNRSISERLSAEIIDQILSLLPIKSQVQLAMTCKYWNTYVFNFWPRIWNTVQLTCLGDYKEHLLCTIPGRQVRHLIIDAGIPWKARERIIANQWDQLESLVYAEGDMAHWHWFEQLVMMNRMTLKRVELHESETVQYSKGWMYFVLSVCPNLETFHCVGYDDSTSGSVLMPTSSISLVDQQLLETLSHRLVRISATSPSIARCLPEILPYCPSLKEISFNDHAIALNESDINKERLLCQILTAIDQHCPMIKKVEINPHTTSSFFHDNNWHPTKTSSGLQSLSFRTSYGRYRGSGTDQVLAAFIEQHHTTLEKISMVHDTGSELSNTTFSVIPMQYVQRLSELDLPKVRDLCIIQPDLHKKKIIVRDQLSELFHMVSQIVQRCHSLEYLQLTDCLDARALQTITLDHLRHLRVLRLKIQLWDLGTLDWNQVEEEDCVKAIDTLCQIFNNHTMTLLSIVELDIGRWVDDRVLGAIGRNDKQNHHILTRLRIGKHNKITSEGLLEFAKDMQRSRLTHLSIHLCYKDAISDILPFSTLEYLINVDIISTDSKYMSPRPTVALFFAHSPNTTYLKMSYTYRGAREHKRHLVYTCKMKDSHGYILGEQSGQLIRVALDGRILCKWKYVEG